MLRARVLMGMAAMATVIPTMEIINRTNHSFIPGQDPGKTGLIVINN